MHLLKDCHKLVKTTHLCNMNNQISQSFEERTESENWDAWTKTIKRDRVSAWRLVNSPRKTRQRSNVIGLTPQRQVHLDFRSLRNTIKNENHGSRYKKYSRLTITFFEFSRLTVKFLRVSRLTLNPIETLLCWQTKWPSPAIVLLKKWGKNAMQKKKESYQVRIKLFQGESWLDTNSKQIFARKTCTCLDNAVFTSYFQKAFQKCLPILYIVFIPLLQSLDWFLQQNEFSTHMEDMETAEFNECLRKFGISAHCKWVRA